MTNTKSISEKILEEYANYYSQVDLEQLAAKLDQLKSEAIKEFAEKLLNTWWHNGYESPDVDFDDFIYNLVKEMVGE